jgi:hypothetical protein
MKCIKRDSYRKYNIKQPDIYLKAKAIKKICKTSDKEIIIFEKPKTKIDDNTKVSQNLASRFVLLFSF